jgi:flagellar biosynthesis chaperone FliJ
MRIPALAAKAPVIVLITLPCVGCVTPGDTSSGSMASASSWIRNVTVGDAGDQTGDQTHEQDLTPAEQRLREQSRAFQKTVWEGALIGASAGALWGIFQGKDTEGILKRALIGGAVGGLAGAYVANKQKQYSDKEDQLDSMIADVRKSNNETENLIGSARQVIAEDKRRLASVEKRYKAGQATKADLDSTRRRVSENNAVVSQATKGAREKYSMFEGAEREYRQENPGVDTKALQSELRAYNQQIDNLDELANTVSAA